MSLTAEQDTAEASSGPKGVGRFEMEGRAVCIKLIRQESHTCRWWVVCRDCRGCGCKNAYCRRQVCFVGVQVECGNQAEK